MIQSPFARADAFCRRYGLDLPILLAPMAMTGTTSVGLAAAVANAGGMGALGALTMSPGSINAWREKYATASNRALQINLWIPDAPSLRDADHESEVASFLAKFDAAPPPGAGDFAVPDFAAQCEAILAARPNVVSSIMGLYPPEFVKRIKAADIAWFANATTVRDALAAEAAGADAIVAQGAEAGGHRGSFEAATAEREAVGLFALLPAIADAVRVPVIAAGGVADGRGLASALLLGASAAQIGTAFLRCPEAETHPAWASGLSGVRPEDTMLTRAFSGRAGRSLATTYVRSFAEPGAPKPAPYPVQRGLTAKLKEVAAAANDVQRMQAWAGQSAALACAEPAAATVLRIWAEARELLRASR